MNYPLLILSLVLIALTRSHSGFMGHLPDFTLPLLILSGVWHLRINAVVIIIASVLIDNYAILHQGVSAHCVTPAYSVLLASYYLTYHLAKYLNISFVKDGVLAIAIIYGQWFMATVSYYFFVTKPWSEFPAYALTWIWAETTPTLITTGVILVGVYARKRMLKYA